MTDSRRQPVRLEALGLAFEVMATGPESAELRSAVERAWDRCRTEAPPTSRDRILGLRVDVDLQAQRREPGEPEVVGSSVEGVLEALTQRVTVDAIRARAGELLMLHACVLSNLDDDRAVVLVGPSGVGKTTLAQTFGSRWGYGTDETAAIGSDGRVLAYPKPLSIIDGSRHKRQVSGSELGLRHAQRSMRVSGLALLDRQPGADVSISSASVVDALCLLAPHTSYLTSLQTPLQRMAASLADADGLRVVTYGETAQLEPILERLLEDRA